MFKSMFKLLPLVLLLTLSFAACKKKEDKKSKMTLLTQKEWFMSKNEEKVGNGAWNDDFPNYLACEKDNKFIFKSDNTATLDEGATKCSASDPQTQTIAWAFTDNETKVLLDGDSYTIDQLDDNILVISGQETYQGVIYYYRISFRH
jgi:hypothetical protein